MQWLNALVAAIMMMVLLVSQVTADDSAIVPGKNTVPNGSNNTVSQTSTPTPVTRSYSAAQADGGGTCFTKAEADSMLGGNQSPGGEPFCIWDDYTGTTTERYCPQGWMCIWDELFPGGPGGYFRKIYIGEGTGTAAIARMARNSGSRLIASYPADDDVREIPPCKLLLKEEAEAHKSGKHVYAGNFTCDSDTHNPPTTTPTATPTGTLAPTMTPTPSATPVTVTPTPSATPVTITPTPTSIPRGNATPNNGCRTWYGYPTTRLGDGGCKFDSPFPHQPLTDKLGADERATYTQPGAGALQAQPGETISMTAGTIYKISSGTPGGTTNRPKVQLQTSENSQGLQTIVTVTNNPGASGNKIQQITLGELKNARVDVIGSGYPPNTQSNLGSGTVIPVKEGTTSITLIVRRQGSGPIHVPFVVKDNFGNWTTFVGHGS